MGQPKATLELAGQSLLARGAAMLREAGCDPVIAVVGSAIAVGDYPDVELVTNPDWASGMASSLKVGLAAATGSAAVIALVDQPGITAEAVIRLRQAHKPGYAIAATFEGEVRTPVLFDAALWAEVAAAVEGDAGARYWLRRHPDLVITVACDDVADPADLDVPEDLKRWELKCS